jgi:hypothetical protein
MDSDVRAFQGLRDSVPQFQSLPPRRMMAMPPQPIVPWTPARMSRAFIGWLMEETYIPVPVQSDA